MGAWGTAISSNDTYADVYGEFMELYDEGMTPDEVTRHLIRENQETLALQEDAPNFWYAVAKAQWECKELQPTILAKVREIIESGEDLKIWEEQDASRADLKKREKVLNEFLAKLETPRSSPRKRKRKKYFDSVYRKGDCLVYRMTNGNYGAAFVLTEERNTQLGINDIALTTIDSPVKPTVEDFEDAEVYVRIERTAYLADGQLGEEYTDEPQIGGFFASVFAKRPGEIEVIGRLPIHREYQGPRRRFYGWEALPILVPTREIYEQQNGTPNSRVFLSRWVKRQGFFSRLLGQD